MKAQALASTGALDNLQSAAVIYAELGDEESLAATQYQQAALLLQNQQYTEAREIFAALGTYKDAATQLKACDYAIALQKKEAGQLDEAAALLESISGYSDADEQLKIVRYAQGEKPWRIRFRWRQRSSSRRRATIPMLPIAPRRSMPPTMARLPTAPAHSTISRSTRRWLIC